MTSSHPLTFSLQTDPLAAIFYAVNCLQEFSSTAEKLDKYGRFKFSETWQARLDCIETNVVQQLIDAFFLQNEKLKQIVLPPPRPSSAFLTHDIDSLFGGFWQEGKWAARHFRLDKIVHLLFLEAVRRPSWLNIDDILRIHTEHDARSTYFFLTEKGRNTEGSSSIRNEKLKIKNADYRTDDKRVQVFFEKITAQGSDIGLHKSTMSTGFVAEFSRLPTTAVLANRYHFLKFQLPQAWQTMDAAGVQLDASLGFAEHFGFRNGYGLPFQPFDFEKKTGKLGLIVAPMHIMDGNFDTYMRLPESQIAPTILDFFEKNRTNAVLNVLWHNREFAPFRFENYLEIYKKLLIYLRETQMPTVTASEIIAEFG